MNGIEELLNELGRAHMCPANSSYNEVLESQSSEVYKKKLESLYSNAVSGLYDMDWGHRSVVNERIIQIRKRQEVFDVPTQETVDALLRDYNNQPEGVRNRTLLDDYRFCKFVLECVAIQRFYLEQFSSLIVGESCQDTNISTKIESDNEMPKVERAEDKQWMTIDEIVAHYGLPKNNIKSRQWRIDNDFPYKEYDKTKGAYNKVVFNSNDVENWIKNHK